MVENKFSVLKKRFSGDLEARRFLIHTKEIADKIIVCNLNYVLTISHREGFFQSRNFLKKIVYPISLSFFHGDMVQIRCISRHLHHLLKNCHETTLFNILHSMSGYSAVLIT
jgi:hypothetical protein